MKRLPDRKDGVALKEVKHRHVPSLGICAFARVIRDSFRLRRGYRRNK
jgi:hypothetical protein